MFESTIESPSLLESPIVERRFSIGTWNMDHWKRTVAQRREAWKYILSESGANVMLLQESVVPAEMSRSRIIHREIGGSRRWGSSVAVLSDDLQIEEIDTVSSRYASTRFSMLGTYPGAVMVTRVAIPQIGTITCVSVYGVINVYAQTTMLRIIADLIPLFDSNDGARVVLGGDFNITTATHSNSVEFPRYDAILKAVESLGLINLAETDAERPPPPDGCLCGQPSCHHLHTFGDKPGSQLDWLYATPELARRCRRIRVERFATPELSDHAPVIAEFDIPPLMNRVWDAENFVREMGLRHGSNIAQVVEELIAWALRKHQEINAPEHRASLDRLPISPGENPELWVQLDLNYPDLLQYTFSMNTAGKIVIQFQYMAAPFNTIESRERLWAMLTRIPGVSLEKRLNGRPSFPLEALTHAYNLENFERIFSELVDETRRFHDGKGR